MKSWIVAMTVTVEAETEADAEDKALGGGPFVFAFAHAIDVELDVHSEIEAASDGRVKIAEWWEVRRAGDDEAVLYTQDSLDAAREVAAEAGQYEAVKIVHVTRFRKVQA